MTLPEIIATVIGGIAAAVYIASYQMKRRKWILFFGALSRALFIAQYLLLGAFAGAVLDLIGILAAAIAGRKEHPTVKKWLIPIIALTHASILTLTLLLYQGWTDLFALLAISFAVGALWFSRERLIRAVALGSCPCWLVYNIVSKAYFSAFSDVFAAISLLVAIWRYDVRKKGKE